MAASSFFGGEFFGSDLFAISGEAASGQGSQSASATEQEQFTAAVATGQGSQTVVAAGEAQGGAVVAESLDGAGVGVGNRSWMKNVELVADHRVRHAGVAASGQGQGAQATGTVGLVGTIASGQAQGAEGAGAVSNPCTVFEFVGRQAAQSAVAVGDVTDPELELFAALAAEMFDAEWREAA